MSNYKIKIQSYKNDFEIEGIVNERIMDLILNSFVNTEGVHFTMDESTDEWKRYAMPKNVVAESLLSFEEIDE